VPEFPSPIPHPGSSPESVAPGDPTGAGGAGSAGGGSAGTSGVPSQSAGEPEPRFRLRGRSLRQHAARGTMINGAFVVGLNSLGFLKGFLVAGLITTSDYGLWGILVVALGTLLWLKDVGISDKYIQQSEDDQELAFQKAFTLELMFTGIFFGLLLVAVPIVALVYGRSEIIAPGLVVALMLPAGALSAPLWVFYRKMEFVKQRTLQAIDPLVGFVVTIALAVAGAGYWSFVIGAFAGVWAAALVAVRASPYRLRLRYDRGTMRQYVSFSWPLLVAASSSLVIAQGSILVGEAEVGLAGVGAIALAVTISQYTDRVDGILTSTLYPAICAVRDRTDLLFESFVKSNRLALMWGLPFGVGVSLFAEDLVEFGIGEQWRPAIVLLQAFGLTAAAGHLGFNWEAYFRARGETRPMAVVSFVTMLAFLAAPVPLLINGGLTGFALGMGIMTAVNLAARSYFLTRLFSGFGMLKHAGRAVAPTIPATAAIFLVRAVEDLDRTLGVALAELALYLLVTAVATLALERALLREAIDYLRVRSAEPGIAT